MNSETWHGGRVRAFAAFREFLSDDGTGRAMTGASVVTGVSRRPERADDWAFRAALFRETFGDTFARLDDSLRDLVLRQQLDCQTAGYRATYPAARFDIVEADGIPLGRIVTDLAPEALTIVDIALLRDARSRGAGTTLLQAIFIEAETAGVPVRLRVLASNAGALRLYRRLGFAEVARSEMDVTMQRAPSSAVLGGGLTAVSGSAFVHNRPRSRRHAIPGQS